MYCTTPCAAGTVGQGHAVGVLQQVASTTGRVARRVHLQPLGQAARLRLPPGATRDVAVAAAAAGHSLLDEDVLGLMQLQAIELGYVLQVRNSAHSIVYVTWTVCAKFVLNLCRAGQASGLG